MSTFDRALCVGKHILFDSIDPRDHELAAAFCDTCPVLDACRHRLADMIDNAGYYGHPEGTWAGQLILDSNHRNEIRRLARLCRTERQEAEEAAYGDREMRQAHTAYSAGDRSEWACAGHRVYQRRAKRVQRMAVAS